MSQRQPTIDMKVFSDRRKSLAEKIEGSALLLAANPEHLRNHDVEYPYRQDSNFYYLTGFEEPEAFFLFRPGKDPETVMFVRNKDIKMETWTGFRYGPEAVEHHFKINKAYPIEDFEKEAPELLKGIDTLYYRLFKNPTADVHVQKVLEKTKALQGRTGFGLMNIHDADVLVGEMRLIKSDFEIEQIRTACEISAQAHLAAQRFVRPGVSERQVQAVLAHHFLMKGSQREGYNYIVASGSNATTLHYNFNDQICKAGDLLLIDAGAEFNYYTGDITRTFPISGTFTDIQAKVYQGVLDVQKELIAMIKPGLPFKELHEAGTSLLTDLILELGLLSGRKEDIIKSGEQKKYYPHGIGHWLGMDVHDAGLYFHTDVPRLIEPNMVFTIEPGLYIPADDTSAPQNLRGIGIRIEDNLRVTIGGSENLTATAPKEINDMAAVRKDFSEINS